MAFKKHLFINVSKKVRGFIMNCLAIMKIKFYAHFVSKFKAIGKNRTGAPHWHTFFLTQKSRDDEVFVLLIS